jgi:hypothetical protein
MWIPRTLNERSDFNSHLNVYNHYDFCLTREALAQIEQRFGPHSIDRFASDISHQLPRHNTKYFSPRAEALDAFSLNWAGDNNYLFPPQSLAGTGICEHNRIRSKCVCVSLFYVIDTGSIGPRARIKVTELGVTYLPSTFSSDAGYRPAAIFFFDKC